MSFLNKMALDNRQLIEETIENNKTEKRGGDLRRESEIVGAVIHAVNRSKSAKDNLKKQKQIIFKVRQNFGLKG